MEMCSKMKLGVRNVSINSRIYMFSQRRDKIMGIFIGFLIFSEQLALALLLKSQRKLSEENEEERRKKEK